MDTEIRPREPNEKQKAAAYDRFLEWLSGKGRSGQLAERYYGTLLRNFAMEAPDGVWLPKNTEVEPKAEETK